MDNERKIRIIQANNKFQGTRKQRGPLNYPLCIRKDNDKCNNATEKPHQ